MLKTKNTKATYNPATLPAEFVAMDNFLSKNKFAVTQQVVNSIEYAIQNNLDVVEVFNFKNSDYTILLPKKSFARDLENIYKYYIESEKYEFCNQVLNLKNQLSNKTVVIVNFSDNK